MKLRSVAQVGLLLGLAVGTPTPASAEESSKGYIGLFCESLFNRDLKAKTVAETKILKTGDFPCRVSMVDVGSPAEAAGIRKGDLVVLMDGKPFRNGGDVDYRIKQLKPGAKTVLTFHPPRTKAVPVKPRPSDWNHLPKNAKAKMATGAALRKADAKRRAEFKGVRRTIRVAMVTPEQCDDFKIQGDCKGAVIDFVQPRCQLHKSGFSTGVNLLMEIDGRAIKSPEIFYSAIEQEGAHSIKLYWHESDPESEAFQSGMKNVKFDLAQCR